MHDIWNPWHGCVKCSEGCEHCYMYFLDRVRNRNGRDIYKVKANFDYPLQKDRQGRYKVKSGETIRVCMTSDFFLEEADSWRNDAWEIMRQRPDVKFFLLTKRPERVPEHLPEGWGDGWENIFFNVTAENQRRADERIPLLFDLPFKHKGVMCAPFIGEIDLEPYLSGENEGKLEQVICGGENYDGARPCHFDWVKKLAAQCREHNTSFCFIETGTCFVKDGKIYRMPDKQLQAHMALKANLNFVGRQFEYKLRDNFGLPIPKSELYVPSFCDTCEKCSSKMICNGCSNCGKCDRKK